MKTLAAVSISLLISTAVLTTAAPPFNANTDEDKPAAPEIPRPSEPLPDPDPFSTPDPPKPLPGLAPAIGRAAPAAQVERPHLKMNRSFGPEQLTGEPNTPKAGDYGTCWAAAARDGGKDWLELSYGTPVRPLAVWVYENCAPGALYQITGLVDGEEIKLWRGVDPTPRTEPKGISKILIEPGPKYDAIRVYLDCKAVTGWNEVDAVGVLDQDENLRWALSARTTTSYAGTNPIPFFDPFQPPREAFEEKFADVDARMRQNSQAVQTLERNLAARRENLRSLQAEVETLKRAYLKLQEADTPKPEPAGD